MPAELANIHNNQATDAGRYIRCGSEFIFSSFAKGEELTHEHLLRRMNSTQPPSDGGVYILKDGVLAFASHTGSVKYSDEARRATVAFAAQYLRGINTSIKQILAYDRLTSFHPNPHSQLLCKELL